MFGMVVRRGDLHAVGCELEPAQHGDLRRYPCPSGSACNWSPKAVQYLPDTLRILMTTGLLPAALLAIVLNLVLPEEMSDEQTDEISGGHAGHKHDEHV